jgi:hypothetical protein
VKVVPLDRKGDAEFAEVLRGYADDVEAGRLTEYVFVANHVDGYLMRASTFEDRWRMLGALEYAKDAVNKPE